MAVLKCKYPVVLGKGRAFGCGQCTPCRINKRREWTHRIMLESMEWSDNTFLTLTYDEENIPEGGTLEPAHLRDFWKRLRHHYGDEPIRYYAVGEYGDRSERPHYHAALFGFHTCWREATDLRRDYCCPRCEIVKTAWKRGSVHLGCLEVESAAYIAGYTVKKWTKPDDERLKGRHPEFARMSNRPGIGQSYMYEVASSVLEHGLSHVPRALRHGQHVWPLGEYLCKQLSKMTGGLPIAPAESSLAVQELSRKVFEDEEIPSGQKRMAFREAIIAKNMDRAIAAERRERQRRSNETF